jgi:dTDP-4-dehydrorhamnose reductase
MRPSSTASTLQAPGICWRPWKRQPRPEALRLRLQPGRPRSQPDGRPRPVMAPANPITAYGRTKLGGEDIARRSPRGRTVIFRPPVIYGPRDPALVPFFKLAKHRIAPLLMGGRNKISIVYVEDAARAIVRRHCGSDVAGKTYTLDDGRSTRGEICFRPLKTRSAESASHRHLAGCSRRPVASEGFGLVARRAVSSRETRSARCRRATGSAATEPRA